MEPYIMVGSFPLKSDWLYILAGGLAAYVLLFLKYRSFEKRKESLDIVLNAVIFGFAVWKFSYIVFHPITALKNPINILYFNGAAPGIVIGCIAAVIYALRMAQNKQLSYESLYYTAGYSASGFFAVYLGLRYFLAGQVLEEGILSIIMLAAFVFLNISKSRDVRAVSLALLGVGLSFTIWNASPFAKEKVKNEAVEASAAVTGIHIGNKAPDFELNTLTDGTMKLSGQKGKVVFVNLWASWCPPCRAEMPEMEAFYQKHGGKRAEILAVNLTDRDSRKDAQHFADEKKLSFPILLDSSGKVGSIYKTVTIPTTFIINQEGVITNRHIGPMDAAMMEKFMKDAEK